MGSFEQAVRFRGEVTKGKKTSKIHQKFNLNLRNDVFFFGSCPMFVDGGHGLDGGRGRILKIKPMRRLCSTGFVHSFSNLGNGLLG